MTLGATESMIYHRYLLQCQVIDASTNHVLGDLSAVRIDLNRHRVLGFSCRAGHWSFKASTCWLEQICAIDHQRIAVNLAVATHSTWMWGWNARHVVMMGDRSPLEVWTQRGRWLGNVVDYCFELETGQIRHYFCSRVSTPVSSQPELRILTQSIIDAGAGWLVVRDPLLQSFQYEVPETWFHTPALLAV